MQIYVSKDGQQYGPHSVEQLRKYIKAGNFAPSDHACHDGANWVTIAEVSGFASAAKKPVEKQIEKPTKKSLKKLYRNELVQTILYYSPCLLWACVLWDSELVLRIMLETHLLGIFPPLVILALFVLFCHFGFILVTTLGTALLGTAERKTTQEDLARWILLIIFLAVLIRDCLV